MINIKYIATFSHIYLINQLLLLLTLFMLSAVHRELKNDSNYLPNILKHMNSYGFCIKSLFETNIVFGDKMFKDFITAGLQSSTF